VKLGIPAAHVEAGLRSFDRTMPEEINRLVTDAICDLLLVSEPAGLANLEREGVAREKVCYVGNVMIDTLAHELPAARATQAPAKFGVAGRAFGLVTLHRPSNVDTRERLSACVDLLKQLSARAAIVFPVHPRTRERLERFGLLESLAATPGITLTPPISYRENLGLLAEARFVLTDSGGIQEESTYLDVPCLTLRANTERPVTLTKGTSALVGDALDGIPAHVDRILAGDRRHTEAIEGWDGRAAERIVDALALRFDLPTR
jgi:UDP-N-acetylglucosamine 2-epimerase (non-hydrolysing)